MAATNLLTGTINWANYKPVNIPAAVIKPVQIKAPAAPKLSGLGRALNDATNWLTTGARDTGGAIAAVNRNVINPAGEAILHPITDIATGQGGKLVHDTAQLTSDVTGGSANYLGQTVFSNPIKDLAANISKNPVAQQNINKTESKTLGPTLKSALIRLGAESAQTASLGVGGGEVAGLKDAAEQGAKTIVKKGLKDALIGGSVGASNTLANNPDASFKNVAKNTALGTAFGITPLALQGASKVIRTVTGNLINRPSSALDNVVDAEDAKFNPPEPSTTKTPITTSTIPKVPTQAAESSQTALGNKAKSYFSNVPKATQDYQQHIMKEFGTQTPNIVSADSAKFIVDGTDKMNPLASEAYHDSASKFAKDYYQKLLDDPTTKDKPVLITGGGAGAGKTSGLNLLEKNGNPLKNYAAINDTNLTSMSSAESRIEPALKSGRNVQLMYTFRDPVDAFKNGQLPRAEKTGRIVPIPQHVETHLGSLDTIKQVIEKYKDNPKVSLRVVDNSLGKGNEMLLKGQQAVDFLNSKSYNKNQVEKGVLNELEQAKSSKTISQSTYDAYKKTSGQPQHAVGETGNNIRAVERQNRESSNTKSQTERSAGQSTQKVAGSAQKSEQRAVKAKLIAQFEGKAKYTAGSFKEEANKAVQLVHDDPDKAMQIAMGEKAGDNTMHEVAVRHAVENKAIKDNDVDTLTRLASSSQHTETSEAAQRLGAEGYATERDSPVRAIREVQQSRAKAFASRTGTDADSAVNATIKEIKSKVPPVKRQAWHEFIQSLQC